MHKLKPSLHQAGAWSLPVLVLLVTWSALAGCLGPLSYTRTIQESPDRAVRLEARYGAGRDGTSLRFAHPIVLSEADWGQILNRIYVRHVKSLLSHFAKQPGPDPAFDESQRAYLAKYLSEAFQTARPDQWVVFFLTQPREPQVTEITSGTFFIEGDQIHLVLANYRQPVSMSFVLDEIRKDPLRPAGDTFYDLVPQGHQTVRTDGHWHLTKPLVKPPAELLIDYRASLTPGAESEVARGEETQVEARLRALQRLREQGLITDEEYRKKRQRLLDEL
ncbi:MAG: SHOCT domain-containing protein [Candidatus Methylomirabilis sp.]